MSFLDALLGRDKPAKSKTESLFALTTCDLTMESALQMKPTNRAAISFRPVSTGDWADLEHEMNDLLDVSTHDSPLKWKWFADEFEFKWIILEANEFENLIATANMIGDELTEHGFGSQLLAAITQYTDHDGRNVYLIYNYKRATFYPFVPDPDHKQQRLNAEEFQISGTLQKELPIEKEIESWYPLWGVPL
ncbi:MAG TPA: hypothetical protein VG815_01320 [Chloroflexota bacterium]|jgi:hypothetical protein|nr:hypothetical protein [Chloroflexota bacterium]